MSSFCGLRLFRWRGLRRPLRQLKARGSETWPRGGAQLHTLQATHHGGAASTHRPGEMLRCEEIQIIWLDPSFKKNWKYEIDKDFFGTSFPKKRGWKWFVAVAQNGPESVSLSKFKAVQAKLNATINTGQITSATNHCRTYLPHITLRSESNFSWPVLRPPNFYVESQIDWKSLMMSKCLMTWKWFVAPFQYLRPKRHCPVCEFIILPSLTWHRHPHPENPWGFSPVSSWKTPSIPLLGEGFGSLEHAPGYGFDLACSKAVESVCPHSSLTSPSRQPNATTPHSQKFKHLFPGDFRQTGWISA